MRNAGRRPDTWTRWISLRGVFHGKLDVVYDEFAQQIREFNLFASRKGAEQTRLIREMSRSQAVHETLSGVGKMNDDTARVTIVGRSPHEPLCFKPIDTETHRAG